jgi:hypothetical protein
VQDLWSAVFGIPLSKGTIQKMVDRVSAAIIPHYPAIGQVARTSLVNDIDETSGLTGGARRWLWVMANPLVTYCQIHPTRSKEAFAQLIADWTGVLVSDGSLVYQHGQGLLQRCLDAPEPHSQRAHRESGGGHGALWGTRARRTPTAVSYGHSAANGGTGASLVGPLRHTCRIWGRPTFAMLGEAVACLFKGETPELSWITPHESLPMPSTP